MYKKTKRAAFPYGVVLLSITFIFFSACNSSQEKTTADDDMKPQIEAKNELDKARKEYQKKYEAFKEVSNDRIAENEKSIIALRAEAKSKNKVILEEKLVALELQNQALKKRVMDYKLEGETKWDSFREEFNYDMDNLAQSLKDLWQDNIK